ncbi:hypothetical protein [Acinetobacter sp. ANC 5502]
MNMIEKAKKYLLNQFGVSLFTINCIESDKLPIQLRKSIRVSISLINEVEFFIVELNDERVFSSNGQLFLKKLEDNLSEKPIIFIAEELKTRNMSLLRERKLGYIVPGYFCFIPEMLLHHSVQRIKSTPLSIFATTIVMQYLESQLTTQFFANDLVLFGSKMSKSRAISELEERKIIEISKYGRTNRITFLKSKLELWSARKSLLSPICTKIITVRKDLIDFSLDHTFCGETALSVYTLLTPPKRKCIAMEKWTYDDEFYKSENHHVNDSQLIDIYIYPMNFKTDKIRENLYISPIALILSGLKPSDERAFSSYKELEDIITDRLKIKSHDFE